jgi:hypothetical protein
MEDAEPSCRVLMVELPLLDTSKAPPYLARALAGAANASETKGL